MSVIRLKLMFFSRRPENNFRSTIDKDYVPQMNKLDLNLFLR